MQIYFDIVIMRGIQLNIQAIGKQTSETSERI